MKKLNIVLMSILTIVLTSVLVGCNFKKVEAKFSELFVSISVEDEQPLSLDDYLSVKNVEKSKVTYFADNEEVIAIDGRSVTAKSSGMSKVYATYENNYIASMYVVVRKPFSAPTNFSQKEQDGKVVLSWDEVSGAKESWAQIIEPEGDSFVQAEGYNVTVEKSVKDVDEEKQVVFNDVVDIPEIELDSEAGKGIIYDVTVSAVGDGKYFCDGESQTCTVYVGFMPLLEESALIWNNGVLNWEGYQKDNASYRVKINGVERDEKQDEKTKDLTEFFEQAQPGKYDLSVVVYDKTEGEEAKYPLESEKITVTKLDVPQIEKENGELKIVSQQDVEQYVLRLKSGTKNKEIIFENTDKQDIVTTLSAEDVSEEICGIFEMTLEAKSSGLFYHNQNTNLGKIYKIGKVQLEGAGAQSASSWNVKVKLSENLVDSNIIFTDGKGETQTHELRSGTRESQVTLNLTVSTTQTTSHTFYAVAESESTTANGQDVFVVKSNKSDPITVTDLADFQTLENGQYISHEYDQESGNSVFSFKAISGAEKYELYVNDVMVSNSHQNVGDSIKMTLDSRLEKLAHKNKQYVVKVIAKTNDDATAINTTSPEKTITLLEEVSKSERSDSKQTLYTWQEVENADGYKLEIYKIGYDDFVVESTDFDLSDSERFVPVKNVEVSENQFDFANLEDYVGYYYIKVRPTVTDAENFVVSGEFMEDKIAVSVQLQFSLNDVEFGRDEQRYFLKINKLEHVHQFELNVGGVSQGPVDNVSLEENNNRFDLPQDFSAQVDEPTEITLKAIASEDNKLLYQDSEVVSLSVVQIRDAKFSATLDSDISFDNKTEKLFVSPKNVSGMTSFFVKAGASNSPKSLPGQTAQLNLPRTSSSSNIAVEITYYGSDYDPSTKLYKKSESGEVVLSSVTNFSLSRAESPTALEYYNGEIKFVDSTNGDSGTGFFVLRANGPTHNEGQNLEIDVEFRTTIVVYLNGNKIETEIPSSTYLTDGSIDNQKVIKFSEIIEQLKLADPEIDTTYLQLQELTFNVFVYLLRDDLNGNIKIASPDAKLKSANEQTNLVVKKMPKPVLTLDTGAYNPEVANFNLSWTGVQTDSETSFVLTYGEKNAVVKSSTTYSIQKTELTPQTLTQIWVEATNPNYLNSDKSDVVSVFVLRGIESVELTNVGTLVVHIFDKDVGNYEKIVGKRDGQELTITEKTATIEGEGKYTFGLFGKEVEGVHYLGSAVNSWTLQNMSHKAPDDTNIKPITDATISWDAFDLDINSGLEYELIFLSEDETKAFVFPALITNKVDVFKDLAETLSGFEGNLKMQILAHIKPGTTYAKDSTIYYSDKQDLLNKDITQTQEYNYYIYKQQTESNFTTIIKLKKPEISAVKFEHSDTTNYWDAQEADLKVTFKGNYGESAQFKVFVNGIEVEGAKTLVGTGEADVYEYNFTLGETYLNSIENVAELTIQAISDKADRIPSATLKTQILRAGQIVGFSFADDNGVLIHNLKITLPMAQDENGETINDNRADGGVVLKIDYNSPENGTAYRLVEDGNTDLNDWSEDLSEFFIKNMKNGGTFTISGFIRYNDSGRIILPSKIKRNADFKILKSLTADNIEKTATGFKIKDATSINSEMTSYVVEYDELQEGGDKKVCSQILTSENAYSFVTPDWVTDKIDLRMYATQSEYLPSVVFDHTLTLQRIKEVTSVSMERNLHNFTFSWNSVSDAKGYQLAFYTMKDGSREEIFKCDEISETQITVAELFGDNYEKLLEFGKVTKEQLKQGFEILVTIVVVPQNDGVDVSREYEFKINIIAQDVQEEDIFVDGKGVINFNNSAGTQKLYTIDYLKTPETEVEPYGWKKVSKTKLNTEQIDKNINKFKVIISTVTGDEETGSVAYDNQPFDLASLGFESQTFIFTSGIKSIKNSEIDYKNLYFDFLGAEENYTIYAGLKKDEIFEEEASVVEIVLETSQISEEALGFVYPLSTLVSKLNIQMGLNTIYFWSYANDDEASEEAIVSKSYSEFKLNFVSSVEGTIEKLCKNVNEQFEDDYVNTFAVFTDDDSDTKTTLGFNVRITSEDGTQYIKFVTGDTAKAENNRYIEERPASETKVFAINITEIFEQIESESLDEVLSLTGNFKIEISKLTTENNQLTFADWFVPKPEESLSEFAFTRLTGAQPGSVTLNRGDLRWNGSSDKSQFYKVYFISELTHGTEFSKFTTFSSYVTYFNASNYGGQDGTYYLAVQGVNEDPFVVSSSRAFVTNSAGSPVEIVKNQVTNKIKLVAGALVIDWENSDLLTAINGPIENLGDFADALVNQTFKVPFTFTMSDIINKECLMSFEFKPQTGVGASITKNFDATILLTNLFETEEGKKAKTKILDEIIPNIVGHDATITILKNFIDTIEKGAHGIASGRNIFDDEFEKVQTGAYTLSYCLLGGKASLSSGWYSFENGGEGLTEDEKNKIYVNEQPLVKAIKEDTTRADGTIDKSQTSFKVIFTKSEIYEKTESGIMPVKATKYKVRLGEYIFDIIGQDGAYSMVMIDAPADFEIPQLETNIKVYETDDLGKETPGGDYLMFYLNLNGGNSVLGKYRLKTEKYEMQIFAVGNNISASSKSEKFTVNFLSFDESIKIEGGTFVWQPTDGRNTTVIYKKASDKTGEADKNVGADEQSVNSTFALEGASDGLYEYVKFVVKGEIDKSSNTINVDSSVYEIDNVLKLKSPTLSTKFGLLGYDASENFKTDQGISISECFSSKENMFRYVVYNDASYNEEKRLLMQKTVTDDRASSVRGRLNTYETGITGMEKPEVDPEIPDTEVPYTDYDYKSTEEDAKMFYMYMLGSDAEFTYTPNEGENYYITKINFSKDPQKTAIAVRSDVKDGDDNTVGHIKASMLDNVTNIHIENGQLAWNPVTVAKVKDDQKADLVPNADVIYRVVVEIYAESNGEDSQTNISEKFTYYTAETKFDFSIVEKTEKVAQYEKEGRELSTRATVQALSLNVSDASSAGSEYVKLIDGRYAYGSPTYQGESNYYVLMGNCTPKDDIKRIKEIDQGTLAVVDGRLTWSYTLSNSLASIDDSSINTDNFGLYYRFVVVDENGDEIDGKYTLTQTDLKFDVVFVENTEGSNKAKLTSGKHRLKVYTAPGTDQAENLITSFASEEIEVEKLAGITEADYKIVSETAYETLDLSEYFKSNEDKIVYLWVSNTEKTYKFGKDDSGNLKSKLLIITNSNFGEFVKPDTYEDEYVDFLEIQDNSAIVYITFYVEDVNVKQKSSNKLTSDVSERFELERMQWPEGYTIAWNDEEGKFTWNYDDYSLKKSAVLNEVEIGWETSSSVSIYKTSDTTGTDRETLTAGRIYIKNNPDEDGYVEIYYDEEKRMSVKNSDTTRFFNIYTNGRKNYSQNWFNVLIEDGTAVTKEFRDKETFKIKEDAGENTIIVQNEKFYRVNKNSISYPIFLLKVSYMDEQMTLIEERNITTSNCYYAPDIITLGDRVVENINLSVRIKRNENSLQSTEKLFEGSAKVTLFASGSGTKENPYIISNAEQFLNIRHRMTREITSYADQRGHNVNISDGKTYYFKLDQDINLTTVDEEDYSIDGFLFDGVFDGNIDGNNKTITYVFKNVATIKNPVVVSTSDTLFHLAGQSDNITFTRGSALFENLSSVSGVSNLNLNVSFTFGQSTNWASWFRTNLLLAGLTIENNGHIDSVNLTGLSTDFCAQGANSQVVILAYGGIVGKNYGANTDIKNCTISADVQFDDQGYGMAFFYGGVSAFNYATISGCEAKNTVRLNLLSTSSSAQIGGIACSSSASSVIDQCKSSFVLSIVSFNGSNSNASGVVVCGRGSVSINEEDVKDAKGPEGQDGLVFKQVNCAGGGI